MAKEIQYHQGSSVLLLLEGYDELPNKLRTKNSRILCKLCLPKAAVLITSRPSATDYIHSECGQVISQHIEILGFTTDSVTSYIDSVFEEEQERQDFLQYLQCYPYVRGMMYVPLNAVVITAVYRNTKQSPKEFMPNTMTALYTALTRCLLLRYLYSHEKYRSLVQVQGWQLKSFSDLPKEIYDQFSKICKIALSGIEKEIIIFEDLPHNFNPLELMQSISHVQVEQGTSVSYIFFHLTLQEYLAAVSISQQTINERKQFFNTAIPEPSIPIPSFSHETSVSISPPLWHPNVQPCVLPHNFFTQGTSLFRPLFKATECSQGMQTYPHNMLMFIAGLTKYKDIPSSLLWPLLIEHCDEDTAFISLTALHCIFETQSTNTYDRIFSSASTSELWFVSRSKMSPSDCFVLGYSVSHVVCQCWGIYLAGSQIGNEGMEMLVAGMNYDKKNYSLGNFSLTFNLANCNLTAKGLQYLMELPIVVTKCTTELLQFTKDGNENTGVLVMALKQLDVSCNAIGHSGATVLVKLLKENRMLQRLDIHQTSLEDEGAITISEILNENKTIQQLDISTNSIQERGVTALANTLKNNKTLQLLDIHQNSIGQAGAAAMAEMLQENRTLQQLDVSNTSIGHGGTTILSEILKKNYTLQELNISKNSIGQVGAIALAGMLENNWMLQKLDIQQNSIGEGGATALAKSLKTNQALQWLNASCNDISPVGAIALAEMLKENTALHYLSIAFNFIEEEGIVALADMLKKNKTLSQLDISRNNVKEDGVTTLAEALAVNETLQLLNISGNSIRREGTTTLAGMLKENRTLEHLNISNNSIGSEGASLLAEMLKENTALCWLDISNNPICQQGAAALAKMLKKNGKIEHLNMSNTDIDAGGADALAQMLKKNRTLLWLDLNHSRMEP